MKEQRDGTIESIGPAAFGNGHPQSSSPAGYVHLAVGLVLMIAKIALGITTGSKALVVSAMFSIQDCMSIGIILVRSRSIGRPVDRKHPFGFGKLEFVITTWMSLLVLLGVAVLCATIAHSLLEHRQWPPGSMAIYVAAASALVCWMVNRQARGAGRQLNNSAWHAHADLSRLDAYASLAVVGSVIVARSGFELVDSIVAVVEAACVVWCSGRMLRRSAKGLLDASVGPEQIAAIRAAIRQADGAFTVTSIRAVQSGQEVLATIVVDLPGGMSMCEADALRDRIKLALRCRFNHVGQVLVGFRTRDEAARAHDITRGGSSVNIGTAGRTQYP